MENVLTIMNINGADTLADRNSDNIEKANTVNGIIGNELTCSLLTLTGIEFLSNTIDVPNLRPIVMELGLVDDTFEGLWYNLRWRLVDTVGGGLSNKDKLSSSVNVDDIYEYLLLLFDRNDIYNF